MADFIINDYIWRHVFHNFTQIAHENTLEDVTTAAIFDDTDDSNDINEKYNGPQFTFGCQNFDLHVTSNYPHIKKELETILSIDSSTWCTRATVILQRVIYREKDIITKHDNNRYSFIAEAYNHRIKNFKSTTCTASEQTSPKASLLPDKNISKKGRRRTSTSHYEPKTPTDKKKR